MSEAASVTACGSAARRAWQPPAPPGARCRSPDAGCRRPCRGGTRRGNWPSRERWQDCGTARAGHCTIPPLLEPPEQALPSQGCRMADAPANVVRLARRQASAVACLEHVHRLLPRHLLVHLRQGRTPRQRQTQGRQKHPFHHGSIFSSRFDKLLVLPATASFSSATSRSAAIRGIASTRSAQVPPAIPFNPPSSIASISFLPSKWLGPFSRRSSWNLLMQDAGAKPDCPPRCGAGSCPGPT